MNTHTTVNDTSPSRMTAEHWARLHAMTEEQILQNALTDPDNPPLGSGEGYVNEQVRSVNIILDPNIASWLEDHHLDGQKIATALLSQFVAAQSGEKNA